MDKTVIEYNLLNAVYETQLFHEIIKTEEPDFILKVSGNTVIGVEITELFANECNARIRNINNYVTEIIDKQKYRHKDDKSVLQVKHVQILDENKVCCEELDAIISDRITTEKYVEHILEQICNKSKKYTKYCDKVETIGLVLHDTENYFFDCSQSDIIRILFLPKTRDFFILNQFNEIYLIRKIDKIKKESIVICCRMSSLFIDLFILGNFVEFKYPSITDHDQFVILANILCKTGYSVVLKKDDGHYIFETSYGQIIIGKDGNSIYLSYEMPIQNDFEVINCAYYVIDNGIYCEAEKYRDEHICGSIVYKKINNELYYREVY